MNKINVCLACDNNYAKYAGVVIASILCNAGKNDVLSFYILDGGIKKESKDLLLKLKTVKKCDIHFIKIDEKMFADYAKVKTHDYVSIATYYRLKLPTLLPKVKRVIYFDCDMVVNTSLADLFNTNMGQSAVAGVLDLNKRMVRKNPTYVNAGMLVLDLENMKKQNLEKKFFDWTKNHIKTIKMGDQEIINEVLKGKIKIVDDKWNVQSSNFVNRSSYMKYPAVIHFVSKRKPWHYASFSYHKPLYFKYLQLTPWALDAKEYKHWTRDNRFASWIAYIKYRPLFFLRPRFYKALFLTYIKPIFSLKHFFVLLFLTLFSDGVFSAGVQDFYFVNSMKISANSISSSAAKKRALEEAREKAFNTVLSRLLTSEDVAKVVMPDNYNMEKFVQTVKLNNEKTTSSSYTADVNIQINKNLMNDYLKNQGLTVLSDVPPSTLVVLKGGDNFDFMNNIDAENVIPVVAYPSSSFAFNVDEANLSKFQSSIPHINNVAIVNVRENSNGNFDIKVKDLLFSIEEEVIADAYSSVPHAVLQVLNDAYKTSMIHNNSEYISLLIPVYSLADWLDLEEKLSKLSVFKNMEIQALKYNRVQLKIKYNYDLGSVISALSGLGLSVENKGNYLIIKR